MKGWAFAFVISAMLCAHLALAGTPSLSSTTLEAKGFSANQPYFGGGSQGSVNSFTGNLVISETDLTIPGRGLDVSIVRTYNSNIWKDANLVGSESVPSKSKLLKPSWIGYGWDMHFGRIKVPNPYCKESASDINMLQVEWADGSTQPIIKVTDTANYKAEYILPDYSRVSVYNTNLAYQWFVITKPDGTKYLFTHHVDIGVPGGQGTNGCVKGANGWGEADGTSSIYHQYRYNGVYLSRIEDINGNYISVDYHNQVDITSEISNTPNTERHKGCLWNYPLTRGSPFPQTLTDTMGRTIIFHVSNSNSITGRLDHIQYQNVNGKTAFLDYVYAGDANAPSTPNMGCDSPLDNAGICQNNKFLVSVQHKVDSITNSTLFPPTMYKYHWPASSPSFQLTKIQTAHDAVLTSNTIYGSETTYTYAPHTMSWSANGYSCYGNTNDECKVTRRVVRAVTVCEDPGNCYSSTGVNPALTTFYWYLADPSESQRPPGYSDTNIKIPTTMSFVEGPFIDFNPSEDTVADFYQTATLNDPRIAKPFVGTLTQYVALPPTIQWQSYKDGVTLATYVYDVGPLGDLVSSAASTPPDIFRELSVTYYKSFPLGELKYHTLTGATNDRPHFSIVPWGTYTRTKFGGEDISTFTQTTAFDKFANPLVTINFGEVNQNMATFTFPAACLGTSNGISNFYANSEQCPFSGTLTTTASLDIRRDYNGDGFDDDKTITVTQYAHQQNPRYEGRQEPVSIAPGTWPPYECTNPDVGWDLPPEVCNTVPEPYSGTTYQRIRLPADVQTFVESMTSTATKKTQHSQYLYDTTPLLGSHIAIDDVYENFHHRGAVYVGYPKFTRNPTDALHFLTYRGLPTKTRIWHTLPNDAVGTWRETETWYDTAGRAVFSRNGLLDEGLVRYERDAQTSDFDLLYCMDEVYPGVHDKACGNIGSVVGDANNDFCGGISQTRPQDSSLTAPLFAYPTKEYQMPDAPYMGRIANYAERFPYNPIPGQPHPVLNPPTLLDHVSLNSRTLIDLVTHTTYDTNTGTRISQWLDGPGIDYHSDGEGLYQYTKYAYDDLGRIIAIYRRAFSGSLDTTYPASTVTYTDTAHPRKVVVTTKHCQPGSVPCTQSPFAGAGNHNLEPTIYLFDGIGRNYASYVKNTNGKFIYTFTEYDSKGNAKRTYRPFEMTSADLKYADLLTSLPSSSEYTEVLPEDRDYQDRPTKSQLKRTPGTAILPATEATYGLTWTKSKDVKGTWSKTVTDVQGKTLYTLEGATQSSQLDTTLDTFVDGTGVKKAVQFTYDAAGNLHTTTVKAFQAGAVTNFVTTQIAYNTGESYKTVSPDAGESSIIYDNAGRPYTVYQAAGPPSISTLTQYDGMGRPILNSAYKSVAGMPGDHITYTYDQSDSDEHIYGVGRVTRLGDRSGITTYQYDNQGRLAKEMGPMGTILYNYNQDGTVHDIIAKNYVTTYDYDRLGRITAVKVRDLANTFSKDLINNVIYNTHGSITSFLQGPAHIPTTYTYIERGSDLVDTIDINNLFRRGYTYDDNGNIDTLFSDVSKTTQLASFTYDIHNRLTGVQDISHFGTNTQYTYDDLGNRRSITTTNPARTVTPVYDSFSYTVPGFSTVATGSSRVKDDGDFMYKYDGGGSVVEKNLKYTPLTSLTLLSTSAFGGWFPKNGPSGNNQCNAAQSVCITTTPFPDSTSPSLTALRLRGDNSNQVHVSQRFRIDQGQSYTITGWIKTETATTNAYGILATKCYRHTADLGASCTLDNFGTSDGSSTDRRVGPGKVLGAGLWHKVQFSVRTDDPQATHLSVACHLFGDGGNGLTDTSDVTWCRDITVTPDTFTFDYDERNRLTKVSWPAIENGATTENCIRSYYNSKGERLGLDQRITTMGGTQQIKTTFTYLQGRTYSKKTTVDDPAQPVSCTSVCGNNILEAGEECDGSNVQGVTCKDWHPIDYTVPSPPANPSLSCTSTCTLSDLNCPSPTACGNGVLEVGEECEFLDLNCRFIQADQDPELDFVCDSAQDGSGCGFSPNDPDPITAWYCKSGSNSRIFDLSEFENLPNPVSSKPTIASSNQIPKWSGYGSCYSYRHYLDVGDLEIQRATPVVGCGFPMYNGAGGCHVRLSNENGAICKCDKLCPCQPVSSSPLFSKSDYGDIPEALGNLEVDCDPPQGDSSPFFRLKSPQLTPVEPETPEGPYYS